MIASIYRLGEYKVIRSATGELTWEAHAGFGAFRTGRCFRTGSILFIGAAAGIHNGFLKGEFLDRLRTYPPWTATAYYCTGAEVFRCGDGKRVTVPEMTLWTPAPAKAASAERSALSAANPSAYRLQRYEITCQPGDQIRWRSYSGANAVSSGSGFILENILFIDPVTRQHAEVSKRQFLRRLQALPQWRRTPYYCRQRLLRTCDAGARAPAMSHAPGALFSLKTGDASAPAEQRHRRRHLTCADMSAWCHAGRDSFLKTAAAVIRSWARLRGRAGGSGHAARWWKIFRERLAGGLVRLPGRWRNR